MARIRLQNAIVAAYGSLELIVIFVHHAEIQQSAEVGRKNRGGPLVKLDRLFIVAAAVIFQGQSKESAGVLFIRINRAGIQPDNFVRVRAQDCNRGGALVQVLSGLLNRSEKIVEDRHRGWGVSPQTFGFGSQDGTESGIVASLLGVLVAFNRPLVIFQSSV